MVLWPIRAQQQKQIRWAEIHNNNVKSDYKCFVGLNKSNEKDSHIGTTELGKNRL